MPGAAPWQQSLAQVMARVGLPGLKGRSLLRVLVRPVSVLERERVSMERLWRQLVRFLAVFMSVYVNMLENEKLGMSQGATRFAKG